MFARRPILVSALNYFICIFKYIENILNASKVFTLMFQITFVKIKYHNLGEIVFLHHSA